MFKKDTHTLHTGRYNQLEEKERKKHERVCARYNRFFIPVQHLAASKEPKSPAGGNQTREK